MSCKNKPRLLSDDGAKILAAIHAESFPNPWDEKAFASILAIMGTSAWIIEESAAIVIRVLHEQAEIITMAVRPQFRRQGLGNILLSQVLEEAIKSGAKHIFLEVDITNEPARFLYEKTGFSTINQRKAYYQNKDGIYTDALVMSKELA